MERGKWRVGESGVGSRIQKDESKVFIEHSSHFSEITYGDKKTGEL